MQFSWLLGRLLILSLTASFWTLVQLWEGRVDGVQSEELAGRQGLNGCSEWDCVWLVSGYWWCPWGLTLGPVLFSILIHDPDAGIEYPIRKLADNIKLGGAIVFFEEQEASKENFDGLEHWAILGMKWK